jgi:3,4-dihydroxy 2-butanone 4-phosphate synthase/GTP cyclohydrolase II
MKSQPSDKVFEFLKETRNSDLEKPQVTLSYAQSIDGSLTWMRGQSTAISGPESMQLTHQLRAHHDAILVGIGTVLADDPQLSVRLVKGDDPRPIILDSKLRIKSKARILNSGMKPWIFCAFGNEPNQVKVLENAGAKVFPVSQDDDGKLDITEVLQITRKQGISTIMLEGGRALITSFLALQLVDKTVITIAPRFIGGLNVLEQRFGKSSKANFPTINPIEYAQLGQDLILWGELSY